jgi:hypothetical protein
MLNFTDLVFAVSDMKEGWNKEFFDSIGIFDEHVPILMIITHNDRAGYIYPAKDYYTFETQLKSEDLIPELIRDFAYRFLSKSLKPFYKNENIEETRETFP